MLGVADRHMLGTLAVHKMAGFLELLLGTQSARASWRSMKATTLLVRQHRNLRQLCETVEGGSAKVRASLLPQLAGDLVAHMTVETQVFYPAASAALREDWMQSTKLRHTRTMESLERVLDAPVDGEEFAHAIGELRSLMELHMAEEENGLFARIEHALDSVETRTLALSIMSLYHSEVETGYRGHSENPRVHRIGHAPLP